MKINFKLKLQIIDFLNSKKQKELYYISYLPLNNKLQICNKIHTCLSNENYFVYKKGTKYNNDLLIISKDKINEFFSNEYLIYDIHTLDTINIGDTAIWDGGAMIEVYTTGNFNYILNILKNNFHFNIEESKFP